MATSILQLAKIKDDAVRSVMKASTDPDRRRAVARLTKATTELASAQARINAKTTYIRKEERYEEEDGEEGEEEEEEEEEEAEEEEEEKARADDEPKKPLMNKAAKSKKPAPPGGQKVPPSNAKAKAKAAKLRAEQEEEEAEEEEKAKATKAKAKAKSKTKLTSKSKAEEEEEEEGEEEEEEEKSRSRSEEEDDSDDDSDDDDDDDDDEEEEAEEEEEERAMAALKSKKSLYSAPRLYQLAKAITGKSNISAVFGALDALGSRMKQVRTLEKRVQSLEGDKRATRVDAMLDNAKHSGKITNAATPSLRAQGMRDPKWLKGHLSALPKKVRTVDMGAFEGQPYAKDVTDPKARREAMLDAQSMSSEQRKAIESMANGSGKSFDDFVADMNKHRRAIPGTSEMK